MNFDTSDIKKIAHLARLATTDDQADALTADFNNILNLVEKMKQSDTTSVKPMSHPFDAVQPLRADTVTETNQRERMQSIAPSIKAGLYIVPQFIETD